MHEAYSHRRVKGEWFRLSAGDVEDFCTIGEADDLDQLPSWVVARQVLNEANGFEWGERDDKALVPTKPAFAVSVYDEDFVMLSALAKQNDRTLKAEMGIALREYFRKHGK